MDALTINQIFSRKISVLTSLDYHYNNFINLSHKIPSDSSFLNPELIVGLRCEVLAYIIWLGRLNHFIQNMKIKGFLSESDYDGFLSDVLFFRNKWAAHSSVDWPEKDDTEDLHWSIMVGLDMGFTIVNGHYILSIIKDDFYKNHDESVGFKEYHFDLINEHEFFKNKINNIFDKLKFKNFMISPNRIQQFISQFPLLLPTVKKLNDAHITWMIAGSGCLFLFGNERKPDDVDMFLKNDEHDRADALFGIESFFYTSSTEHVRNSNPEGSHAIQLTSQIELLLDNKKYSFEITDRVIQKRIQFEYEGNNFWVLSPEDVLLIKALLQRGPEVGKKDVEDINNFLKIYPDLDREYLQARIAELGAAERVENIFSL